MIWKFFIKCKIDIKADDMFSFDDILLWMFKNIYFCSIKGGNDEL